MGGLRVGFHTSHEQLAPSHALSAVQAAEQAGFVAAMCSDHFAPWSASQGESGYAWSWLGAALATTALPFGVVTAPGQRYHPAIVAQGAATLAEMFPDRFWVALGSGQALNEHITGQRWPSKPERNARLRECVDIMRALFAGEEVSHDGAVRVDRARLYSRSQRPPALVAAAVSPETARWAGGWADGLITINQPPEVVARVVEAFRDGGGDGKPLRLQVHLSYAGDDDTALRLAHEQWRFSVFGSDVGWELPMPADFERAAQWVQPEQLRGSVLVSCDHEQHLAWLQELASLGFEELYLHHVGKDQREFLDVFGSEVLPALRAG